MTEEISMDDYFNSLNSNKILIGALVQLKRIEIPVSFFSNVPDSQMMVTVNEDGSKFIFTLKENDGN
jgi:hypothetical protein